MSSRSHQTEGYTVKVIFEFLGRRVIWYGGIDVYLYRHWNDKWVEINVVSHESSAVDDIPTISEIYEFASEILGRGREDLW